MKGLPETGQLVFVIAPSGATIDARVRDVAEGSTELAFDDNASDPVAVLAGGNVAIQYTNRRGVCRVDGEAHRSKVAGVLRVDHTGKVQLIQRREFVRIDAMVRVVYCPRGRSGYEVETTTINVSGGGFMISDMRGLRLGETCDFTIELDGDIKDAGPLAGTGEVVRETHGGLGIRIIQVDEEERERLIRWVFARERLGRQLVRDR